MGLGIKVLDAVLVVLVGALDEGPCVFGLDEVSVLDFVLGLDELNRLLLIHVQLQLLRIVEFGWRTDQAVLLVFSSLEELSLC